jgi:hypothetical protein
MENKDYSKEDVMKLISLAHKNITRTKGKDYSPDVHELQSWIDKHTSNQKETNVDEKWSEKYKKSIDCNNPKGFSQRAHCQSLKKKDTTESMTADASGSFVSALGTEPVRREITKIHNLKEEESDIDEATVAYDAGPYDVAFGDGGKNPLKINGEKSIKNSRAVKDKKFPRYGGPGGVYVKVKDKCKKFPYCNQGNTGALEFYESEGIRESVQKIAKQKNIPFSLLELEVINELKKIFI